MQLGGGQLHSKKFLSILGFCKVHVEKLLVYLYVYNTFGVLLVYDVLFVSCQFLSGTMTHPNRVPWPPKANSKSCRIQS